MAHYFEEASKRLSWWINEDARREDDFFDLPDVLEGETLTKYLARNAHRPDIIKEIIQRLMQVQTDRAIAEIHSTGVSA